MQVTPSNGAILTATIDDQIINTALHVPETNRYYIEWVPNFPGHYDIDVEAVDNDNDSNFADFNRTIIVTPKIDSKVPSIRLLGPTNGDTFTAGSKLRTFAYASDIDGGLTGIKFYVNGNPIDEELQATNLKNGDTYPYSQKFTVPNEGTYTFALATDNSGNGIMSRTSTITSTSGGGNYPTVAFGGSNIVQASVRRI